MIVISMHQIISITLVLLSAITYANSPFRVSEQQLIQDISDYYFDHRWPFFHLQQSRKFNLIILNQDKNTISLGIYQGQMDVSQKIIILNQYKDQERIASLRSNISQLTQISFEQLFNFVETSNGLTTKVVQYFFDRDLQHCISNIQNDVKHEVDGEGKERNLSYILSQLKQYDYSAIFSTYGEKSSKKIKKIIRRKVNKLIKELEDPIKTLMKHEKEEHKRVQTERRSKSQQKKRYKQLVKKEKKVEKKFRKLQRKIQKQLKKELKKKDIKINQLYQEAFDRDLDKILQQYHNI